MEYEAELINAVDVTSVCKSFRFSRPADFEFAAGQFFYITLGKNMVHHFSFSDSPTVKDHVEFTTKMTGSPFKNALNMLRPKDKVKIRGPYGEFTLNPAFKKIAFLSGGIGITPIRSICKYATEKKVDCAITLLYGNNSETDIAFRKDFDEMASKNKKLKVAHVLSNPSSEWTGYKGYITKDVVAKEIPDYSERIFYICGPPGMVLAMNKILDELSVESKNIKLENFVGY